VVQRSDARGLSPHAGNDPDFESALAEAAGAGVRILAYACRVGPSGCALERRIPVVIRGRRLEASPARRRVPPPAMREARPRSK
jgi:sugar fermentation stimulation protein A